jgi:hypothetical protein
MAVEKPMRAKRLLTGLNSGIWFLLSFLKYCPTGYLSDHEYILFFLKVRFNYCI